ncbi:hypothetical protein Pcac1_g4249 [Phytophthora cactorum]|nr:hypothetical protein Pcac1_g4249 [Phytophthora cactorum]
MMFRQISLLAALPAMALAGGANDVYYTGDGTANAGSNAYQAGKVEPADEKQSKVSILQANEEGVENQKDDSETQQTNTKSGATNVAHGGTSPFIVALIVLAAVCGIALAAVFYTSKKKSNKHDELLTKSFDTFSSPSQKKKKAAIVTI